MRKKEEEIRDLILSGETKSDSNSVVLEAIDSLKNLISECDYNALVKGTVINKLDGIKMLLSAGNNHSFHGFNKGTKSMSMNKHGIRTNHVHHNHSIDKERFENTLKHFKEIAKKDSVEKEKSSFSKFISNLKGKLKSDENK